MLRTRRRIPQAFDPDVYRGRAVRPGAVRILSCWPRPGRGATDEVDVARGGGIAARRPRGTASPADTRAALDAFQRAVETGDLQSLLDILAPDVVALSDGGGVKHALLRPVRGAGKVARLLAAGWWKRGGERSFEPVQVNGSPGLLVLVDGQLDAVLAVRVENGYVTGLYGVRNPEKLSRVARETAVSR